ncbi:TolC family protein [Hymenobacter setariae]|uniref:TolC family protein n=1 Tax=Hymenobacter setariae TaxID=2594794 RepID=A0A558C3I7_9BACT|nr:TolC family protein [Hymenobacter setariae]TVT43314.1 TolC family protein [Hymenobacter setariae]
MDLSSKLLLVNCLRKVIGPSPSPLDARNPPGEGCQPRANAILSSGSPLPAAKGRGWGTHAWLLLLLLATFTAHAQQALTLAQTQAAALSNNVAIKNRDLGRTSALEGIRAARWAYFPTVSGFGIGLYGFRNFVDPIPELLPRGVNNFYIAGLSATENIYAGGQVGLSNRLARLQSSVSEVRYADVRDSVNMETEQKYWQVVQAQEQLRALQASERYLNQLLKELRDNLKAGLIARNDLLKVQVQRGQILLNESRARNGRQLALLDLGLYTGLPTDSTTVLTDTLATIFNPASVYVPPAEAAKNTRSYQLLNTAVEARRLQTRLKRASFRPTLSVGVSGAAAGVIDRGIGSTFTPTGLAIVNLPISNLWGAARNQVRQQRLNETIAENNLQNGTNQLQVGIQQAYYSLREAYQQTGLATQTQAQATENLKVQRDSFRAGLTNLSDLLDAQAQAQQAASQLISARAEFRLRLSMYQYLTAPAAK